MKVDALSAGRSKLESTNVLREVHFQKAPAGRSQLLTTKVLREVYVRRSGSTIGLKWKGNCVVASAARRELAQRTCS